MDRVARVLRMKVFHHACNAEYQPEFSACAYVRAGKFLLTAFVRRTRPSTTIFSVESAVASRNKIHVDLRQYHEMGGSLSRTHWADSRPERKNIMATIANLAKQKDGSLSGTLIIPSHAGQKIVLTPVEQKGKGPNFRVAIGAYEAGAAWKRETEKTTYFSVVIDEPALTRPIYCALFKSPDGYVLLWDRPKAKKNGRTNDGGEF
jgi:uncharacterized protein (DUF736 family)